ncbi:MAG: alpha/beta hydrolase [Bacteroidota bacterium]|nr:alpha/beta hydrolase [Bacteroidota bacterium]
MKKIFLASLIFIFSIMSHAQTVLNLYEGEIPNSKPCSVKENETLEGNVKSIFNITVPTLTVYLPAQKDAMKTAVLICPGGAYFFTASKHEGDDVALLLNKYGIAAFVLKYRIPDDRCMTNKEIVPLQDAQRAIEIIRQNATKWNINADKLGIMGFSAGGHLAASASTHFAENFTENKKKINLRPDFSILVYGVISFTDSLAHMGSRENLIGKDPSAEKIKYYSNELQVTAKTPPAFLVHAADDDAVKLGNSLAYFEALKKNNVAAGKYIYEKGGHGFGLHNPTSKVDWMEKTIGWMIENKLMKGDVMSQGGSRSVN